MEELTKTQSRVRDFVESEQTAGRAGPSLREIAAHCGFASSRAAGWHVERLVARGVLNRDAGKARSLRLVSAGRRTRTANIPVLGSIPAGMAQDLEQESGGCVAVDLDALNLKPTARTFALRVRGDSMTGRSILDGDLVLLEHGQEPRHGDVVAALIDGASTLKTFVLKNRKPFLKAENPKYPDLIPAEELMIQGVFLALIRRRK